MRLTELINRNDDNGWASQISVTRVIDDSRLVQPGDVFVFDSNIIKGGESFVADALSKGAAAVVTNMENLPEGPVLYNSTPGAVLAKWAKLQMPEQPEFMVGVTGTNGKTSVAWFYKKLMDEIFGNAASIGTLGIAVGDQLDYTGYTSPTALKLHESLQKLHQKKVKYACMEVSSHALSLQRVDGCDFKAAAFTNLTQDHLDFHGDMDMYMAAKARLFSDLLPVGSTAVIPIQRPECWPLAALCKQRDINVLSYGSGAAELVADVKSYHISGMVIELKYNKFITEVDVPLVGDFQALNIAAAVGLCLACGATWQQIEKALPKLTSVPGRMEIIKVDKGPTVVVDFAHTPDSLRVALESLRPQVKGRLVCVFGCGGDRDPSKRPLMGKFAADLADLAIVTDDNPRSENPEDIRKQVMDADASIVDGGARDVAIKNAIEQTSADDIVLLAGKGHESGQIINGETLPFDDRVVARQILESL